MPSALTYPGVYVEEVPSSVRTIVGVGTSIAAFVGPAKRGPVDEPVTINSFGDFQRIFGGVWEGSSLGHAVQDFYLNGGSQAVIVRVFKPKPKGVDEKAKAGNEAKAAVDELMTRLRAEEGAAGLTVDKVFTIMGELHRAKVAAGSGTAIAAIEIMMRKTRELASQKKTAPTINDLVAAADAAIPVVGKNITAAKVEAARRVATKVADVAKIEGTTAQDVIVEAAQVAIAARRVATEVADVPKIEETTVQEIVEAAQVAIAEADDAESGAKLVFDAVTKAATPQTMSPQLLIGELAKFGDETVNTVREASVSAVVAKKQFDSIILKAESEGNWGNNILVRFESDEKDSLEGAEVERFNIRVYDSGTKTTEFFRNVTIAGDRPLTKILQSGSSLLRAESVDGGGKVKLSKKFLPLETNIWKPDYWTTLSGGSDSEVLSDEDFIKEENNKKGLFALEKVDLFNILHIPPFKITAGADGKKYGPGNTLLAQSAAYCARRRAMLLIDHPDGGEEALDKTKVKDAREKIAEGLGHNSINSAMFFPGLLKTDGNGEQTSYASCGAVAGVFARTDTKRGVWKAPAGFEASIAGTSGLRVQLTDAENGEFNPLGINCLRSMPGAGRVIWGARTLAGDDRNPNPWKYISVRRTALYIEESLYRGTHWVVFEPNDEPLWAQIRLSVGAFMNDLFRQGAFQGRTPRDAYEVKCDQETNPQNDIDKGIVNIWVGFAPLKPAEFVVLKLRQIAGNIET